MLLSIFIFYNCILIEQIIVPFTPSNTCCLGGIGNFPLSWGSDNKNLRENIQVSEKNQQALQTER